MVGKVGYDPTPVRSQRTMQTTTPSTTYGQDTRTQTLPKCAQGTRAGLHTLS